MGKWSLRMRWISRKSPSTVWAWGDMGNGRASTDLSLRRHGRWYSGEVFRQESDSY
jgi:hypothetical protein